MVSRKKAKGRARKVAKAAKAAEEAEVAALNGRQEGSLEAQMQRLSIGNLLQCRHGMLASSSHDERLCLKVLEAVDGGSRAYFFATGNDDFISCFEAGIDAAQEKYAMCDDVAKVEMLVSYFSAIGTQGVLDGDLGLPNGDVSSGKMFARKSAALACYFDQCISVSKGTQREVNWIQVIELHNCDDIHSCVKFLRKRIPCSCLDIKYKEVKSLPRFGMCCNAECILPNDGQVERNKMFSCSGCDEMHYCSRQCQNADWSRHKEWCKQWRG